MRDSSLPERVPRATGAMFARAAVSSALAANRRDSRIEGLRSDGPLVLRKSNPKGPEPLTHRHPGVARVALAAGTAGPLGGDGYALDVRAGAGSTLVLTEVSAMLVLPGADGARSHMAVTITIEDGATLVWWPEPIIAAHRCHHRHDVRIALAPRARLVLREEMILGRHGEPPGDLASRLRITRNGAALYDQCLSFGPRAEGWNGGYVLGDARAVGTVIAVDPAWQAAPPPPRAFHPGAVLAPLAGPGIAVSAVGADSLELRRLLTRGLHELGPPWAI